MYGILALVLLKDGANVCPPSAGKGEQVLLLFPFSEIRRELFDTFPTVKTLLSRKDLKYRNVIPPDTRNMSFHSVCEACQLKHDTPEQVLEAMRLHPLHGSRFR